MGADSEPPVADDSLSSKTVGKYEILKPLATGGMAELYLARARGIEGFSKLVALKRVKAEFAGDTSLVQMFLDEARTMATLNHGNIVQVYDIGSVDGSYFFTMEFLHGVDLRAIFKVGRPSGAGLPLEHALHIATNTLGALHYAHEKSGRDGAPLNLVHRDVSPANIFVTYQGDVKLLDFGIAKAANQSTQTRAGVMKGKVRYMAPEQVVGAADLDRRVDVFAISIVLWELTTGRRLFAGASEFETLRAIMEGKIPKPSEVVPDYPPELEKIVLKGLAHAPEDRWQTAREMQTALLRFGVEQRLASSTLGLSEFVSQLFHAEIAAWEAARLEGKDLAQYVIENTKAGEERPSSYSESNSALHASSTGKGSLEGQAIVSVAPAASRSRVLPLALGGALVGGLALLGYVRMGGLAARQAPAASVEAAAVTASASAPATSVTTAVVATPKSAASSVGAQPELAPSSAATSPSPSANATAAIAAPAHATRPAWRPSSSPARATATTAAPSPAAPPVGAATTTARPRDPDDPNL